MGLGLGAVVLLAACDVSPPGEEPGAARAALGEPQDGFPNWEERVVHVWGNRARSDPAADLMGCTVCAESACYTPQPPLAWNHNLARAARFHSANLADIGRGLSHDSLCTVVGDINTSYDPGPCDGSVSCGCEGGMAACSGSCTGWSARISMFGTSPSGENIARAGGDPVGTFYLWLHEPDSSAACGFRSSNGHRYNILARNSSIGVGYASGYWTQDFSGGGSPDGIVAGVHTPQTGTSVELRANWYSSAAPTTALVNLNGTCEPMTLERGSGTNGTYLATATVSGCTRYYFQFDRPSGTVTYPSTGSFGIGCAEDWSAARPGVCGCTPTCGTSECGDDGCGGNCGACGAGSSCVTGACICSGSRLDCGGSCVNTSRNPSHCGGCGMACAADETCVGGACIPPGVDGGPVAPEDAGPPPGADAGPGIDSGVPPGTDGGPGVVDAGGTTPPEEVTGSCGCQAPGRGRGTPWVAVAALALLALVHSRGRRRRVRARR